MTTLELRAYGRAVGIRAPDGVLQLIRDRLPPAYQPTAKPAERTWAVQREGRRNWVAFADGAQLSEHDEQVSATEAMLSDLELWVAERARRAVFVHAGCAVAGGRAIVMPGYSYSGKTSLTAALVRAGATYYSDEFAVLDHRGAVRPYPRPLSMRTTANATRRVPVGELRGETGRGPAPVGLIAALRYDAGDGFVVTPSVGSRAALLLVQHAVPARLRPRATLNAIRHASDGAVAVVGTRGEADDAASALLEMLPALQSSATA
jgi:hypothetical protein